MTWNGIPDSSGVTDASKGGINHVYLGSIFTPFAIHAKLSPMGVLVLARFSR